MIKPAKIQVRFSDIDVMGHVNNAVYLSYFEMTRVHYFKELLGLEWDWKSHGILLVRNEIDYIKPILIQQVPEIHMFFEEAGSKSIRLSYEVKVNGEIYTKGVSVMVSFDSRVGKTTVIPEEMKAALETLSKPE
jgi:acyl-CoA thioester hydrolase